MFYKVIFCLVIFTTKCLGCKEAPIIGVLSQEIESVKKYFPDENFKSFIAASYVKFLESSGARVIPIWIGRDKAYYKTIVDNTNGILWPGGSTALNNTNGYGDAAKILYDLILEKNKNGVYYPLLGICLGMQRLVNLAANDVDIRENCNSKKESLPLVFTKSCKKSKLFSKASREILYILERKNVTYNFHRYCFSVEKLKEVDFCNKWRIISTNRDVNNFKFVSSIESKIYPFYGVQFHPEKNSFEFKVDHGISHTTNAVKVTQYFSNFFVSECRKNNQSFKDWEIEHKYLIYNYNPVFTALKNSTYQQLYMFTEENNSS